MLKIIEGQNNPIVLSYRLTDSRLFQIYLRIINGHYHGPLHPQTRPRNSHDHHVITVAVLAPFFYMPRCASAEVEVSIEYRVGQTSYTVCSSADCRVVTGYRASVRLH